MSVNIEMPKLSDTMTEGTLIKWHKKVGDSVEIGDILAEIETDKATMEMEAFDDGIITSILIQEGEKANIGNVLAVLGGGDVETPIPVSAAKETQATPTKENPFVVSPAAYSSPATVTSNDGNRIKSSPLARKIASDLNVDLTSVTGTGPGGRIVKAPD